MTRMTIPSHGGRFAAIRWPWATSICVWAEIVPICAHGDGRAWPGGVRKATFLPSC